VVYDVTDRESFKAVDNWMAEVEKFASESAIKLFVGNKSDMDDKRKVTYEEGKELAARYNVKFMETSAKNAKNVIDAYQTLAREIKAKVMPKKKTATGTPSNSFHI
jgi:Ras-related protein Rab-1A